MRAETREALDNLIAELTVERFSRPPRIRPTVEQARAWRAAGLDEHGEPRPVVDPTAVDGLRVRHLRRVS